MPARSAAAAEIAGAGAGEPAGGPPTPVPAVRRSLRGRRGNGPQDVARTQFARLLHAGLLELGEHGYTATTIELVLRRGRISRRTMYDHFGDRDEFFAYLLDAAFAHLAEIATSAYAREAHGEWARGIRAAVVDVLAALDAEPQLGCVCVVEALAAGPAALRLRRRALAPLARLVEQGVTTPRRRTTEPPVTATGLLGCAQELLHDHFSRHGIERGGDLPDLARQITYLILVPYLEERAARREAVAAAAALEDALAGAAEEHAVPDELAGLSLTDLQRRALAYVATRPGSSSSDVTVAVEVKDAAQISRLLRVLRDLDLAQPHRAPGSTAYAWVATPLGEAALAALDRPAEPAWLLRVAGAWTPAPRPGRRAAPAR